MTDENHVEWDAHADHAPGGPLEAAREIRPERDPARNLLYGAGIHVCPGAPLARLEMRVFMEECFKRCNDIGLDPAMPPVFAHHPAGGYHRLRLRFR